MSQAAAKIARKAIDHNRAQGFLIGPNMHDSLALTAFLDPSILKFENYYVDVEVNGELTAGQTLGYSPNEGDLRRTPEMQKEAESRRVIRGSAPTLACTKNSPVIRDKYVPNAKVALQVDSPRFFDLPDRTIVELKSRMVVPEAASSTGCKLRLAELAAGI